MAAPAEGGAQQAEGNGTDVSCWIKHLCRVCLWLQQATLSACGTPTPLSTAKQHRMSEGSNSASASALAERSVSISTTVLLKFCSLLFHSELINSNENFTWIRGWLLFSRASTLFVYQDYSHFTFRSSWKAGTCRGKALHHISTKSVFVGYGTL